MRVLVGCVALEGHFRPLLPLARALADAGHEVTFATGADREQEVVAAGLRFVPAGLTEDEAREPAARQRESLRHLPPREWRPHGFGRVFGLVHAPPKVDDLLAALRAWPADVVLHETADLAAPVAAAALGLPTVHCSPAAIVSLEALERAAALVEPLWRREGLEPEPYAGAFRGLFVDRAPPSFAWGRPPCERTLLRPAAADAEAPPPWLEALGAPLVYVTLGTVFNSPRVLRTLLDAVGGLPALVTTGRDVDPGALGAVGPHARVERFVPQAQVLPRCAAVVTHGGSGTTFAALAHGVPLVLVPQGADQFDNAGRCEDAGAAVVVPPEELTEETVRSALRRVLDEPAFAAAARALAAEIAEMPGPDDVVRAIEAHVARG